MTTAHTKATLHQIKHLVGTLRAEIDNLKPINNDGSVLNTTLDRLMQDASFKISEARSIMTLILNHQERSAAIRAEADAFKAPESKQIDLEAALEQVMLQHRGRLPNEQELVRSVLDSVRRCVNTQQ